MIFDLTDFIPEVRELLTILMIFYDCETPRDLFEYIVVLRSDELGYRLSPILKEAYLAVKRDEKNFKTYWRKQT